MTKPPFATPDRASRAPSALLAVDRAIDDLRRGVPVVVVGSESAGHAIVAAELAARQALDWLARLSAVAPVLAITAQRASTLHIRPTGADVVVLDGAQQLSADALRTLVDPTTDLAHPLRGPFPIAAEHPPAAYAAAVTLCRLARLLPAVVAVPLENDAEAAQDSLLRVAAADIESYETDGAIGLVAVTDAHVPLDGAADARITAFRPADGGIEHLAIVIGDPSRSVPVLVRLHSACLTGDLLASLRCDCGQQLRGAVELIAASGGGVILYLAQEGRGIGLINKLRAYQLQDQGFDTMEANERLGFEADERVFLPAAEMLRRLGFLQVRLLTNNPAKMAALARHGIDVVERVPHTFPATDYNAPYLATKAKRAGHLF